jgi:hypothetical protein
MKGFFRQWPQHLQAETARWFQILFFLQPS